MPFPVLSRILSWQKRRLENRTQKGPSLNTPKPILMINQCLVPYYCRHAFNPSIWDPRHAQVSSGTQIDSYKFYFETSNSPQEWLPCWNIIVDRERGQKIGLSEKGGNIRPTFRLYSFPGCPPTVYMLLRESYMCIALYNISPVNNSLSDKRWKLNWKLIDVLSSTWIRLRDYRWSCSDELQGRRRKNQNVLHLVSQWNLLLVAGGIEETSVEKRVWYSTFVDPWPRDCHWRMNISSLALMDTITRVSVACVTSFILSEPNKALPRFGLFPLLEQCTNHLM